MLTKKRQSSRLKITIFLLLTLTLAFMPVKTLCAQGVNGGVSLETNSKYVFVIGPVAYNSPTLNPITYVSWKGVTATMWSSYGYKDKTFHEVDFKLGKDFTMYKDSVQKLTIGVLGLVWLYPDGTVGTQTDYVTRISVSYGRDLFSFGRTSLTAVRMDIYPYKDMDHGSGYHFILNQTLPGLLPTAEGKNQLTGNVGFDTFYAVDFYPIGEFEGFEGLLFLRSTISGSYAMGKGFSLNANVSFQQNISDYDNIRQGFFGGVGIAWNH